MLDRRHRLTSSAGFTSATRRGRRAGSSTLVLHLVTATASEPDPHDGPGDATRVGFVVSRAVGNAVTRNRVRRRLRHLLRDRCAGLPHGSVLVVRALPTAAMATSATLARDLDRCLGRLFGPSPSGVDR